MTQRHGGLARNLNPHMSDPWIGMTIGGRYTIRSLIGQGGMGLVYLASQEAEPRDVVIKVLGSQWLTKPEVAARFEREAWNLQSLHHPNIVELYDFGQENGRAYLVMEYLQGEPLHEYLQRKGRLSLGEFAPIAAQVLNGIGYVHSQGIVMRDVTPSNLMLCERKGRENFVKILDFGLAKFIDDDNPLTTEFALGTVGYVAPEIFEGALPDYRLDVYAIGVLFYRMLAGRMPHKCEPGNSAVMLYKTVHEDADPLAAVLPDGHDVPGVLIDLIHQCLERDPDARPADAIELVEDLIDALPPSMFMLPVVRSGVPARNGIEGNTGLIELINNSNSNSSSGSRKRVSRTSPVLSVARDVAANSRPSTAVVTRDLSPRRRRTALTVGFLIGGLVAASAIIVVNTGGRHWGSNPPDLTLEVPEPMSAPTLSVPTPSRLNDRSRDVPSPAEPIVPPTPAVKVSPDYAAIGLAPEVRSEPPPRRTRSRPSKSGREASPQRVRDPSPTVAPAPTPDSGADASATPASSPRERRDTSILLSGSSRQDEDLLLHGGGK